MSEGKKDPTEDIARGLLRCQRQPQVRAYLEEFAMTKRQFARFPR